MFLIFFMFNYITISCIYLFLTPNSRSVFRAGVSLNIHSFIHSLECEVSRNNSVSGDSQADGNVISIAGRTKVDAVSKRLDSLNVAETKTDICQWTFGRFMANEK